MGFEDLMGWFIIIVLIISLSVAVYIGLDFGQVMEAVK